MSATRLLRLMLCIALAFSIVSAPGASQALTGSTFDETDGNLVIDGNETDWASFAGAINCEDPFAGCAIDKPTGGSDDAFGQGSKDDDTTLMVVDGSIPNNKSDLARLYLASETLNGIPFLYLAWVRNNTLGTANFSIELNQIKQADPPEPGNPYTILRTAGDLLVLFDFSSGGTADKVQLRVSEWVTSGDPNQVCEKNNTVPCWGKAEDFSATGKANGSVNTLVVTDELFPEPGGGDELPELTFGEAAVNLEGLLANACEGFGSALIRSRSSDSFNAAIKDFIAPAPVDVELPVDVSNWASNGEAVTVRVFDTELVNPAQDLGPTASSSQTGPGVNEDNADPESVDLGGDSNGDGKGDVLHADLLAASAKSVVDEDPAITTQNSSAIATGVDILQGTVTAEVIKALAATDATVNDANADTDFSGVKNLRIDTDGDPNTPPLVFNNVAPNTKIGLSPTVFGSDGNPDNDPDSYVEIRREILSTSFPPPGTPLGSAVEFAADVEEITMLHVHILDRTPDPNLPPPLGSDDGDVTLDVVISSAKAHSESDGILCNAVQAVEANATVLRGNVGSLVDASIGNTSIPEGGGASHNELENFVLGNPPLATLSAATSHSEGSWSDTSSTASAFAHIAGLCVDLGGLAGCEISADAIQSAVSSTASDASRTSTGGASFVKLKILGEEVNPQPGLIQTIPGVGLVAINERTCDVGTLNGDTCTTTDGTKTAMTVRALHIVVTEPLPQPNLLGLTLGSEIVIGEAHSGATFVSVP